MRVKCLAHEHYAVPQPGLEPGSLDPDYSTLTLGPRPSETLKKALDLYVIDCFGFFFLRHIFHGPGRGLFGFKYCTASI